MQRNALRTMFWLVILMICAANQGAIAYDPGDTYIYADIWVDEDDGTLGTPVNGYGTATGEIEGCPEWYPDLEVENDLREVADGSMDWDSNSGFCFADASTSYVIASTSDVIGGEPGPSREFYSRGSVPSNCVEAYQLRRVPFLAIFQYSGYNKMIFMHEWVKNAVACSGKCQWNKQCTHQRDNGASWLQIAGFKISAGMGIIYCKGLTGEQFATQPACVQEVGPVVGLLELGCPPFAPAPNSGQIQVPR
jgi:hypothetical protein